MNWLQVDSIYVDFTGICRHSLHRGLDINLNSLKYHKILIWEVEIGAKKSEYVINLGPYVHIWNHRRDLVCVARDWYARGDRFESGGNHSVQGVNYK